MSHLVRQEKPTVTRELAPSTGGDMIYIYTQSESFNTLNV